MIRIGCDIVQISRIAKLSQTAKEKIFHKTELKNATNESLAGILAAKECCKKIFGKINWHDIEVKKYETGKPQLILTKKVKDIDLSISHDAGFAIAVVIANIQS